MAAKGWRTCGHEHATPCYVRRDPDADRGTGAVTGRTGLAWQDRALCAEVGTELFFPPPGVSTAAAKRVCMLCGVRAECLEYALRTDEAGYEHGIWAGLSPQERRALARQRGITPPAPRPALYPGVATVDAAAAAGVSARTMQRRRAAAGAVAS